MHVLIAVDSFKGSLSSQKAGEAMTLGIQRVFPKASTEIISMADGGEGTVEAIVSASKGEIVKAVVTSPLGDPVEGIFGKLPDDTVVLEMASASGLPLVSPEKRNPLLTSTQGTGELIRAALDLNPKEILIGIGGSATNDGGAGMAQALGARLLDREGRELKPGGGALEHLEKIDITGLDSRLQTTKITVMCDVDNPLCGPRGASVVYGPQKGADLGMVQQLDQNLARFSQIILRDLGMDFKDVPGAGAAGGLGMGLLAFAGAKLKTGIEAVLDTVDFDSKLQAADIVLTGEGRIDGQSIYGKVPMGVAKRAHRYGKPTLAIVGSIGAGSEALYEHGLSSIITIVNGPMSLEESMENAFALTADATERGFRILQIPLRFT
ncbi:glycerate kinase [Desulfitobacterium dichloroeliminans LMG P-21439]|uniref:Glycerate kinase n=1 Tax=Desulfitobacterium dichloroeliminans (strain LMG P-21439 / DCA1) TaxID=871963 RepID=L0FAN6_DESDL|nr:glycerate kinase [Desulfitobacterium dichloroeliminans]AGA69721.1 glycerate kinase [Desulfitobacterium dichloroeliminans LMG P-21439]